MPRRRAASVPATPALVPQSPQLTRLEVQRLATIESLELALAPGLSVFTGETGAGKSIIVDALGLLAGDRGGAGLIRAGAEDLLVTGFVQGPGGEAVYSRRVGKGRSHARVDGEIVTLRELQAALGELVTIHGQHGAYGLTQPGFARELLDGASALAAACKQAWRDHSAALARLRALERSEAERAREADVLTFQLAEIDAVSPQPGEDVPLDAELTRLGNLEGIAAAYSGALDLLSDGDTPVTGQLSGAVRALGTAARHDPAAAPLQEELRAALSALEATAGELRAALSRSNADPEALARIEARVSALGALERKYGPSLDDVLAFAAQARARLGELAGEESAAGALRAELGERSAALERAAADLSAERARRAPALSAELQRTVRRLGMPHARLEFVLTPLPEPGPHGAEEVALHFSANPGEPGGPLSGVASGGELSRVMLAVSAVTGSGTPLLVFDEVDAGLGGAAALKVADELAALARERQVLVVTHLPQIAARAGAHYRVEKAVEGGRTLTRVRRLAGAEREAELARMLAGSESPEALEHARALLRGAAS